MSKQWIRLVTGVCLLSLVGAGYGQERTGSAQAQQPQSAQQSAAAVVAEPEAPRVTLQAESTASVLRLMKFSGLLRDPAGNARTGAVGLTFALYKDQQGGAPLWLEVHNAQLDEQGRYTVLLGSTKNEGLPLELFSSGEARWMGVQVNLPGEEEQPRVLLVSVPYALKAADAETLGGKPPSAFVLAEKPEGREAAEAKPEADKEAVKEGPTRQAVQTLNFVQKQGASALEDSSIFDNGTNVGIGTTNPNQLLHLSSANPVLVLEDTTSGLDAKKWIIQGDDSLGPSDLAFKTINDAFTVATDRVKFTRSGNVGIGTANPNQLLHLTSGNPVLVLEDTTAGLNAKKWIIQGDDSLGQSDLAFKTINDAFTAATERVKFMRSGNVGIGAPNPGEKLEVNGNVKITGGGNGIVFPDSTVQTSAAVGDITGVVASIGLIGGATSGVATLELSGGARSRGINYLAGCDSCGLLLDADDQKTFFQNVCDAVTINTVTCFSDAGSPIINVQRQVGVAAPVNVLSPDLTCSTTGAPGTIVGAQSVLNTNDKLDFVMVTAGGVAKRVTVVIKTTLN